MTNIGVTFPQRKISETFLEFAEPLVGTEPGSCTRREVERALKLACTLWNAVVFDAVRGTTQFVAEARRLVGSEPTLMALVEMMIARKQTQFGHDLRLIGKYQLLEQQGEWRLRVESRSP